LKQADSSCMDSSKPVPRISSLCAWHACELGKGRTMSVEQYSEEIIVVAVAEGPSALKIWLREETPGGLAGDLQWLRGDYMDCHIVLDLADLASLESANYRLMLDLRELAEESDYRLVLCGLSPHLKWQLQCLRLDDAFDVFDTREAALLALAPQDGP
jgi:anti-anti-sigma regulatory factor